MAMGSFACANPTAGRPCVSTAADDSPPAAPATRGGSLTAATNSQPAAPCGHDPGGASTCSGKMPSGKWPPSLPLGIDRARSGKAAVRLRPHPSERLRRVVDYRDVIYAPRRKPTACSTSSSGSNGSCVWLMLVRLRRCLIKVGNKQARRTMVGVLVLVHCLCGRTRRSHRG